MPDWAFRIMAFMFTVADFFTSPEKRLEPFDILKGYTVIDYGCGTGRYLPEASELVGDEGLVYAVDIHELAIQSAYRILEKQKLENIKPVLTDGKTVNIPSHTADIVYALDMFHMVRNPQEFLNELHRLTKPDGFLYLEDGHQPRTATREKVLKSGCWSILGESRNFIQCKPE